jgi:F0F1-type ATP synthase delta subunit
MSSPGSIVDAQLQHLLEFLETHRDEQCAEMLAQARSEAQQEIRQAYNEARARLHQAVLYTREQARLRLTSAAARQQTRKRQQRQQQDQVLLERAWQPLQELLQQRWQEKTARQQWIEHLLLQASAALVDSSWQIEHPGHWPAEERNALEARLGKLHEDAPVFMEQPAISAGLRICAGGTCVDGSIAGLLRDRTRIESVLLARLNECRNALK